MAERVFTNKKRDEIGTLEHTPGGSDEITVRPQGKPLIGFHLRISGTLDNAQDNANDASRNDFGEAKVLSNLELLFDGKRFVDLRGDDLFTLQRIFQSSEGPELTQVDPTVASSDFVASLFVPLMPRYFIQPRPDAFQMCHFPGLAVPRSGFRLRAEFEGAAANANSDAGTGALANGGDHTYSFTTDPDITVQSIYAPMSTAEMIRRAEVQGESREIPRFPLHAPRISTFSSTDYDGDTDDFTVEIPGDAKLALLHIRELEGTGVTQTMENLISRIRVEHDDEELRDISREQLAEEVQQDYPGITRGAPAGTDGDGATYLPFAGDHNIGGALPLGRLSDPQVVMDLVDPPQGGSGRLRFIKYSLVDIQGATTGSLGPEVREALRGQAA